MQKSTSSKLKYLGISCFEVPFVLCDHGLALIYLIKSGSSELCILQTFCGICEEHDS